MFSGPDPAVPGRVRRWIVLEDGVRGVSDGTSNTIQVGESTATRHVDGHRRSRTPTPPATIQDGTSNTIQLGESTATATPTRPATRTPSSGTIQDGTSNTIQLGESTANRHARREPATRHTEPRHDPRRHLEHDPARRGAGERGRRGRRRTAPAPAVTTCPKDTRCPPPAPPKDERAGGSVSGGTLLPCPVLETLIKTLLAPAKTDPVARRQLVALTTQAKANGC